MRGGGGPLVPMLVHQAVHDDAAGLWQVGILLGGALHRFHLCDEEQLLAVGAEREAFDAALIVGQPVAVRAVRIHFPHLHGAALVAQIGQFLAVLDPGGLALLPLVAGQLGVGAAVGVHHEYLCVALVLGHAVVAHGVGHLPGVGRHGHAAYASHGPEGFGRQAFAFDPDVRPLDEEAVRICRFLCGCRFLASSAGGCCQKNG